MWTKPHCKMSKVGLVRWRPIEKSIREEIIFAIIASSSGAYKFRVCIMCKHVIIKMRFFIHILAHGSYRYYLLCSFFEIIGL